MRWLYPDAISLMNDPWHIMPMAGMYAASNNVDFGDNHIYDRLKVYGSSLMEPAMFFLNRRNIGYKKMLKYVSVFDEDTLSIFLENADNALEIEKVVRKFGLHTNVNDTPDSLWSYVFEPLAKRDLMISTIMSLANSRYKNVRLAAIKAVSERWGISDIMLATILKLACNDSWFFENVKEYELNVLNMSAYVRGKAKEVWERFKAYPRGRRSFSPPKKVYKICAGNVLVEAEIPWDAEIRGGYDCHCRASKAIITDIIGDFYGERIGISGYDHSTIYRIGDRVGIMDFNRTDDIFATGFHFFCTKQEALDYGD